MIKLKLMILSSLLLSGCGYLRDRGNDFSDIFYLQIGGGLGAKARVGPINLGLNAFFPLVGAGAGSLSNAQPHCVPNNYEMQFIVTGIQVEGRNDYLRNKGFETQNFIFPTKKIDNPAYYTQIEMSAAVLGGLKVGFNPGELLDFILGIACIDIYGDDLSKDFNADHKNSDSSSENKKFNLIK